MVTDFCNECGNCVTVCPTAGEPYRDKPRLYLDRAAFEAETANAVMLFDDGTVEARYAGATHQLSVGDVVEYQAPGLRARLEADTLAFLGAEVSEAAVGLISLRPAAEMYALARGLRDRCRSYPACAVPTRMARRSLTQPTQTSGPLRTSFGARGHRSGRMVRSGVLSVRYLRAMAG